jgi:radical SAM protein with 4Fe4S-binding SPASM domain
LIEQLAGFDRAPVLEFTGGVPFQRLDLYKLIRYAAGVLPEVVLYPWSASSVNADTLGLLQSAGLSRLALNLEGWTPDVHDAASGVYGSFEHTLGLERDALALPLPIEIRTTLSRFTTVYDVNRMADFLRRLNIVLWTVEFPIPAGRDDHRHRLHPARCEDLFEALWLNAIHQPYSVRVVGAPHFHRFIVEREEAFPLAPEGLARAGVEELPIGINDGRGIIFIAPDGRIYPGPHVPLVCGRFPDQSVADVYRESPLLQSFRDPGRLKGKCGECEARELCGGSRARALLVSHNPLASDPACAYVPVSRREAVAA